MAFMYCQSCGSKIEYSLEKPNFCMNCGVTLSSSASLEEEKEPPPAPRAIVQLEYSIDTAEANILTIGDVVQQKPLGSSGSRPAQKSKTGDPIKDSIDFCRPSKSVDIDDFRGEK